MKSIKTITISLPEKMGKEIQKIADEEGVSASDLIRESFRQYKVQRIFQKMAKKGQKVAKGKGLF